MLSCMIRLGKILVIPCITVLTQACVTNIMDQDIYNGTSIVLQNSCWCMIWPQKEF